MKQLQEKNQREEVLGRLEEQYARLGEELPMGVRLAELKKLKELQADAQKRIDNKTTSAVRAVV